MRSSDAVGPRSVRSRPAIIAAPGPVLALVIALLLTLLSGCSAVRLAYNQAPELSYWWLDSYFDFSDEQTPRVRSALGQWFDWHRRTQVPDYVALLQRAQADVLVDQSPERLCGWWGEVRGRFETAVDRGLPAAAEVMLTMSPAQIAHVERRYAKSNAEFREDYLAVDPKQRLEKSVQRVIERAELLYGRLDAAQRERIARGVSESPFDAELWLGERERRQQEGLQMLRRVTTGDVGRDTRRSGSAGLGPAPAAIAARALPPVRAAARTVQLRLRGSGAQQHQPGPAAGGGGQAQVLGSRPALTQRERDDTLAVPPSGRAAPVV